MGLAVLLVGATRDAKAWSRFRTGTTPYKWMRIARSAIHRLQWRYSTPNKMQAQGHPSVQTKFQLQLPFGAERSDLSLPPEVLQAVEVLAHTEGEERGAVFTRSEVVDFILDLVGYTPDRPLFELRLLEPSFGLGDFLFPSVDRLLDSVSSRGLEPTVELLKGAMLAVELHKPSFIGTRQRLALHLIEKGVAPEVAEILAEDWLVQGDFLLTDLRGAFTHIIGNPPYLRQESIPGVLLETYRQRFATLFDRADLYIPFFEHCLTHLAPGGVLGFICTDRWMRNKYGGPLRQLVADSFHLRAMVDMVGTPAFHEEVTTYPAITVIAREPGTVTRVARRPTVEPTALRLLATDLQAETLPVGSEIEEFEGVVKDSEPWLLASSTELSLVRRLEREFPTIQDAGCKISIGVASGADKIYVAPDEALPVERERKLPLVMTKDINPQGELNWQEKWILNPYEPDGSLCDIEKYPAFKAYVEKHREKIAARNTAKNNPKNWYKTIDPIHPQLTKRPKLLIPDMKMDAVIAYDEGRYYPHHNLYYIVSDAWDLLALRAVLMSGIARIFVSAYSTKMRGGTLRFQAQFLRRIRIPRWSDIDLVTRNALCEAARDGNRSEILNIVARLYNMDDQEAEILLQGSGANFEDSTPPQSSGASPKLETRQGKRTKQSGVEHIAVAAAQNASASTVAR